MKLLATSLYISTKEIMFPKYKNGLVAQLVRALACHARGRGFEPHPSRHSYAAKILCISEISTQ